PFTIVAESEANKAELGDEGKWGKIELDVFRPGGAGGGDPDATGERTTLRQVTRRAKAFAELKQQGPKASVPTARAGRGGRNLITGGTGEGASVETVAFEGQHAASRTITYYERKN